MKQTTQLLNESINSADANSAIKAAEIAEALESSNLESPRWADSTIDSPQVQKLYDQIGKETRSEHSTKEKLIRSDFKKILIKGVNKSYWSFKSVTLELEVCLEPCLGGFCIAIYENKFSGVPTEPELKEKKICTNIELPEKLFKKELIEGTQERSEETWDKGLKIANSIWRKYKNNKKLKKWGMIDGNLKGTSTGAMMGGATASGYLQTTTHILEDYEYMNLQLNG